MVGITTKAHAQKHPQANLIPIVVAKIGAKNVRKKSTPKKMPMIPCHRLTLIGRAQGGEID